MAQKRVQGRKLTACFDWEATSKREKRIFIVGSEGHRSNFVVDTIALPLLEGRGKQWQCLAIRNIIKRLLR